MKEDGPMRKLTFTVVALLLLLVVSPEGVAQQQQQAKERPLKVVMFSGSAEYNSKESVEGFAKWLREEHGCECVVNVVDEKGTALNGVEGLETADVAVFFTRRVKVSEDQLARVKRFVASGRGVVGIRTASHGF